MTSNRIRTKSRLIIGIHCLLSFLILSSELQADTTVYLVRHAEKSGGKGDPVLNEAGTERSQALARTLRSQQIKACYATQFKRTQQTAQPTATQFDHEVTKYQAGKESSFISKLKDLHPDENILVVGHSNTVPKMIRLLGVENQIQLTESDYDDLFVVRITEDGSATLIHLHYGSANPVK